MKSLEKRIKVNNCPWLGEFLKEKLNNGDLRTYNRIKKVVYYFPAIVDGLSKDNFNMALKHPDDSYICVTEKDHEYRYKGFDEFYKKKNGKPFELDGSFESRYMSLKDIFDYFGI